MTSSRSPGTMTSARGPMRWSMCRGSMAPMLTPPMTWSRSGPGQTSSPWTPSRTMDRVGLDRIGRYGRTPSRRMPWRARPRSRVRASSGFAARSTLLTMAPATRTPACSKRALLSTISSIGRPTPPSDTMTAGCPEHGRHGRVGEVDDGPDAGVPGALDEQDVALGRERGVGLADARRQVVDDLAIDERLGEAARDVDRAHPAERLGQAEDGLHEHRVLVGRDAVLDDRALADGLAEAGRQAASLEAVHDPQADRRLAPVLAGRGEVQVAHQAAGARRRRRARQPCAPVLRSTSEIASRSRATDSASTASGSRYGPRRSRMSVTRPRKTLASAMKNCGSLL